jgi:prevent-host-death family protein
MGCSTASDEQDEQMQSWSERQARARFSAMLDRCLAVGPQLVTRGGQEAALLISIHEWRRLQDSARPSLKQLLLSDQVRFTLDQTQRSTARRRTSIAAR